MQNTVSITVPIIFLALALHAQPHSAKDKPIKNKAERNSAFVGEYKMDEGIINFTLQGGQLILVVPGAPPQQLQSTGKNEFVSLLSQNMRLKFVEEGEKIVGVISEEERGTFKGTKISDENVPILSIVMDSLLVLRKTTDHFIIMYTAIDSNTVDSVGRELEKSYKRILTDFKIETLPNVKVRMYPDLKSFHQGINFPEASNQLLATAFGKDDIRMVSPNNAGPESWMLAYVAAHELTHCVHLNIDYAPNNPRWLWEGVAQYEARWFFDPKELDFIVKKEFPRLADLKNGMEYMLGFVIIEAIKDIWGFDSVLSLIKNRGDIQKVFNISEQQFENRVFNHIYMKYLAR